MTADHHDADFPNLSRMLNLINRYCDAIETGDIEATNRYGIEWETVFG